MLTFYCTCHFSQREGQAWYVYGYQGKTVYLDPCFQWEINRESWVYFISVFVIKIMWLSFSPNILSYWVLKVLLELALQVKPNRSTFYTSLVEWVLWPELHTVVRMLGGDQGVRNMSSFAKTTGCLKHLLGHFLFCFIWLVKKSATRETNWNMIHEVKFCPVFLLLSWEKVFYLADTQTFHMTIYVPSLTMVKRDLSFKPAVLKPEPASESVGKSDENTDDWVLPSDFLT